MINLDAARALIAERVAPLLPVRQDLATAVGCRLALAPHADTDVPQADLSAMDGFAVRAEDTGSDSPLPVAFEVPAGTIPGPLKPKHAARIFTGAILPAGADTIVPQEDATARPENHVVLPKVPPGCFVRRAGEVCTLGSELLPGGMLLTTRSVALLGSAGAHMVTVIPRPRIAFVSTGGELISIEQPPRPGTVRDCNLVMLTALAKQHRCEVSLAERVGDDADRIRDLLWKAAECAQVIVTCGGVSVGDYDLVPRVLAELGAELLFHKVSIQPGKPLLVARLGAIWVVGLPGNPMSALVGWRLFAAPLCEALAGDPQGFAEVPRRAALTARCGNHGNRTLLAPARLEMDSPEPRIMPLAWKGSHDVAALAQTDALLRVEPGEDHESGDLARYYPLD